MVDALLARVLAGVVRGATAEAGFSNPGLVGRVAWGRPSAYTRRWL
jgi:hypothetical protein